MLHFARSTRALALTLTLSVGSVGFPALAGAPTAALSGRIVHTGSGVPLRDAVLKVALRPQSKMFESTRTDARGSFALSGLPSGTYDVAVEAGEGVYLVNGSVSLQKGERRSLMLSVQEESPAQEEPKPAEPAPAEPGEPAPAEPKPEEPAKEEPPPEQPKGPKRFYRSAWFGAAVVVGSAVIVGSLVGSSDEDTTATGSPSEN